MVDALRDELVVESFRTAVVRIESVLAIVLLSAAMSALALLSIVCKKVCTFIGISFRHMLFWVHMALQVKTSGNGKSITLP